MVWTRDEQVVSTISIQTNYCCGVMRNNSVPLAERSSITNQCPKKHYVAKITKPSAWLALHLHVHSSTTSHVHRDCA